ncbi:MAG TPA: response regulator transcription factor [Candidatus Binatia bacterium]|nr:response regulator transcription factor [Candidatus Binatia bacterium]
MRLLLIEDDGALAGALSKGLAGSGFAVDSARTGADAQSLAARNTYDLVILDLGLPDVDGLDLLARLRAREPHVPVLVLTARGTTTDRVTGLDAGADDYVAKPFAFAELEARLRALLRRPPVSAPTVLRYADVELDRSAFAARRGERAIALTPKEFAILELFLRHPERLVTRTMILERCWDEGYEGLSNLVDVHVSRLRRKLDDAGRPLLHTLRGAGFVLSRDPR